jgi:PAS domain S-box-containing protein
MPTLGNKTPLIRYSLAVLAVAVTSLAIYLIPVVNDWRRGSFVLLFFGITQVAFSLGLGPSLFALVLSLVTLNTLSMDTAWVLNPSHAFIMNAVFCALSAIIITTIHKQQKLTKALFENQQDLKLAQSVAKIGNWRFDFVSKKLIWSDEIYHIFETPKISPLNCEIFFSLIHPEDKEYVIQKWQAHLQGAAYDIEHRLLVGGTVKWVHEICQLEHDKKGKLLSGFGTTQDITAQKKITSALERKKQELRLIMDLSPNLIAYVDTNFRYVRINKSYENWWHKKPEEILGHDVRELVGEKTWNSILPYMERARWGEKVSFEQQTFNSDDNYRWVNVDYVPDIAPSGSVKGILIQVANITASKMQELKQLEIEERMRLATSATGVGIWEWNILTNEIHWDNQMFQIFGIPPTKDGMVQYTTWSSSVLPDELPKQEELLQETIRSFGDSRREYHIQRPDGQGVRLIEAVETVRTNSQGLAEWMIGTNLDITERRKAETILREQENQLQLIMNLTPALIAYLDTDFRYVRANKTYEDWYGIALNDIIGRTAREIVSEDTWKFAEPQLEQVMRGEIAGFESKLTFQNNVSKWVKATFVPDMDETGAVKGIVVHVANIDERKQAEQKIAFLNQTLHNRIDEMQAIFDTAPIGVAISDDSEGKRIRGNPALERMIGLPWHSELSLRNAKPKSYQVFEHDKKLAIEELPIQKAIKGEKIINQALDILRSDGEMITLLSNAVPLISESGAVRGAVGAFLDITELKKTGIALRESEERLRLAQQAGELGIFDQDLVSGKMQWDERLRDLWGVMPDEPLNTSTWIARVHPDDLANVNAAVNRSFAPQGNGEYYAEYRIIRPTDKRIFWVAAYGTTTFANDQPARLVGFVQDISERKFAEAKLSETEARLTLAMNELKAGFWSWNLKSDAVFLSSTWKQQLGYEDEELPNAFETWESLLHPDDKASSSQAIENYLSGRVQNYELEFRLRHKDGSYRWIHSRATLMPDLDNQPNRLVGIHLDVTEFKKAQETNEHREKMEETFRLQVAIQTAAAIAHELNQPLTAISYFADAANELISKENPDSLQLNHVLESCSIQALRAGDVIRQLLSVLHKSESHSETLDINKLIIETVNFVKSDSLLTVKINLNLANALTDVICNNTQIQKVIIILLQNSVDSMQKTEANSGTITVSTTLNPSDPSMVQITVCDNGIGMPENVSLNKLFQPFFTTKPDGLGMGLAISRALINSNGGKIWVEQNADVGLSFHFTLPSAS